eukprot:1253870-Pleurochrysis_carterae.AAC.1
MAISTGGLGRLLSISQTPNWASQKGKFRHTNGEIVQELGRARQAGSAVVAYGLNGSGVASDVELGTAVSPSEPTLKQERRADQLKSIDVKRSVETTTNRDARWAAQTARDSLVRPAQGMAAPLPTQLPGWVCKQCHAGTP